MDCCSKIDKSDWHFVSKKSATGILPQAKLFPSENKISPFLNNAQHASIILSMMVLITLRTLWNPIYLYKRRSVNGLSFILYGWIRTNFKAVVMVSNEPICLCMNPIHFTSNWYILQIETNRINDCL